MSWIQTTASAVESIATAWLGKAMHDFAHLAKSFCKKKDIEISIYGTGRTSAALKASGPVAGPGPFGLLSTWAFDSRVDVPVGGFKPKSGEKYLLMKPEGFVWRTRSYTKFSGQTLPRRGFIDQAREITFDLGRLEMLGVPLAKTIGKGIALGIKEEVEAAGFKAIVL